MKTLYLHVGHSKTGTSWIQSVLSLSGDTLSAHGLIYPCAAPTRGAQTTEIGQGNAKNLAWDADLLAHHLREHADTTDGFRGVVLSSEELFPQLSTLPDPACLPKAARAAGFEQVEILLFIRNPVAHAVSLWQQYIKRGGGTVPLPVFFDKYCVPERVLTFLEGYGSLGGLSVETRNYSVHSNDLMSVVSDWLSMGSADWLTPHAPRINRAMTRTELELQREINRYLGKAGAMLSDALCEGLPNVEPDDVRPSVEVQAALCDRLDPVCNAVNARIFEAEGYQRDIRPAVEGPAAMTIEASQLTAIADALGGEIQRLRRALRKTKLPNQP